MNINEAQIRKVLDLLEKQVDKDEKSKLNESDLIHVTFDLWKDLVDTSHEWEITPGELLRMCAAVMFGAAIYRMDLTKIWKKIVGISRDKVKKLIQAATIIKQSVSSSEAMHKLKTALGLNLQPALQLAESYRRDKKNGKV